MAVRGFKPSYGRAISYSRSRVLAVAAMLITFLLTTFLVDWAFAREPVGIPRDPVHVTERTCGIPLTQIHCGLAANYRQFAIQRRDVIERCSRRQSKGRCNFDDQRCSSAGIPMILNENMVRGLVDAVGYFQT